MLPDWSTRWLLRPVLAVRSSRVSHGQESCERQIGIATRSSGVAVGNAPRASMAVTWARCLEL